MLTISLPNTHIEKYVGDYKDHPDFVFQEKMRRMDRAVWDKALKSTNSVKADAFVDKGWGQVISAAYLLKTNPKISEVYKQFLIKNLGLAIDKGVKENDPFFTLNVRGFTRPMMIHPTHPTHPGKYFDWQSVEVKKPITDLNQFVKEAKLQFSLDEGKLFLNINLKNKSNIFDKLWETDFKNLLETEGYTGLEKNNEPPHITLINSEVIANIKEEFKVRYGLDGEIRSEAFFKKILHLINEGIENQEMPIKFTELNSTYSEDHSLFEEVIVANLESPYVEKALQLIIREVGQELNIQIPVKPKSSYHLTVATKYREPDASLPEKMEDIINNTGEHAKQLNSYWKKFIKV